MIGKTGDPLEYWKGRTDRTLDKDSLRPDAADILRCKDRDAETIDRPTLEWVRRRLESMDSPSVLDVGCGFGRWSAALDGAVGEYMGVDPVERRVTWAKQHFPSGTFRKVDAAGLWQLGRRFDVVFFAAVLQHLPLATCRNLLRTAANHTKPGGVILLAEWGMEGLPEGPPKWDRAPEDQFHVKPFADVRAALVGHSWSGTNGRVEIRK
jgi:SAM-dependent methyltransferase